MAALSVQSSSGGKINVKLLCLRRLGERGAQALIGGDAPRDNEGALGVGSHRLDIDLHCALGAVADDVGRGLLEAGAEIGDGLFAERRALHGFMPERGLEAGEREMRLAPPMHRPRQRHRRRAPCGFFLDGWAARITETEQLRRFVEGFAQRIVEGGAETDDKSRHP